MTQLCFEFCLIESWQGNLRETISGHLVFWVSYVCANVGLDPLFHNKNICQLLEISLLRSSAPNIIDFATFL